MRKDRQVHLRGIGSVFLFLFVAMLAWMGMGTAPVFAQDQQLSLGVSKAFGYSSGADIRGSMVMTARGPATLQSVVFLIDGKVVGEANAAPFQFQFNTTNYPSGFHDLSAVGKTSAGQTLNSNVRHLNFATAQEESSGTIRVIFPILGVTGLLVVVMLFVQFWAIRPGNRKRYAPGTVRNYGIWGGAVCPKCGHPYPMHVWGINVFGGKLDRCENCGRWSVVRRRSADELRAAESAELAAAQPGDPIAAPAPEEQLRQKLDDSRFTE